MMGTYNLLDLTALGRNERDVPNKMEWVRHHDRYQAEITKAGTGTCCHANA
jgi:predicted dithiol-disulfide oxidoreductase (DUF899 family)